MGWHGPKSLPWLEGGLGASWMALSLVSAAAVVLQVMFHTDWARIKFLQTFKLILFPLSGQHWAEGRL